MRLRFFSGLIRRIARDIRAARRLARGGVTPASILLYPIRRRSSNPRNQLDLRSGISIISPSEEPLLDLFQEIWIDHCYAPNPFRIPPGRTIVDLGANIGVFSIWASMNIPDARLIAVEPLPRMCDFLRRNLAANRVRNVKVVQCACAGRSGEAVLYSRGPEAVRTSLYGRDVEGRLFCPVARAERVPLDDLFRRFEVQTCGFLKIDCEGAEYDILLNASDEILRKIERIALEYHVGIINHGPEDLDAFLASHGFEVERTPLLDEECGYLYATRRAQKDVSSTIPPS